MIWIWSLFFDEKMKSDESVASGNVTISGNQEDISKHFPISAAIVNKCKTQIRITKKKLWKLNLFEKI